MSKKSELVRGYGLAMSLGAVMDEIRREQGVSEDEFHILATPEGRPHLERMIVGLKLPIEPPKPVVYLRPLYGDEQIVVGKTDGTRLITEATDVFTGRIDPDFKEFGFDVPARPTVATEFIVCEQIMDGTLAQNFDSLSQPRVELCSTPHQAIEFIVKHCSRLRGRGDGNLFLLQRADGEFFVLNVCVHLGGSLDVFLNPFLDNDVWHAKYQHRFMFPKRVPLAA